VADTIRTTLTERAAKFGIEDVDALLDGFLATVEKWEGIVTQSASDDEIVDAMMTEIYDKM
jgi:hypothetical protein